MRQLPNPQRLNADNLASLRLLKAYKIIVTAPKDNQNPADNTDNGSHINTISKVKTKIREIAILRANKIADAAIVSIIKAR